MEIILLNSYQHIPAAELHTVSKARLKNAVIF